MHQVYVQSLHSTEDCGSRIVRIGRLRSHASSARIFSILDRYADMNFRIAASDLVCKTGTRGFCSASNALHFGAPGGRENDLPVIMWLHPARCNHTLDRTRAMVRRIYPSHVHFDQLFKSVGTFGLWGGGDTRAQRESFPIYLIPTMGHFLWGLRACNPFTSLR
jgi:hypothetical protein